MIRALITPLLAILLLLGCRPAPLTIPSAPQSQATPPLTGRLVLPEGYGVQGYGVQANAGQVRANATVTLIDPTTFQAKGTGLTAPDGTFSVQAPGSFTPTLGSLYLLESSKALGGAGHSAFRLRTLVQLDASGWTSVSGSTVQLSAATTAVSLLWEHLALASSTVIGTVGYDGTTRTTRFVNLTLPLTETTLTQVEGLVSEALRLNLDPVQLVRPGANGTYRLGFSNQGRNLLINGDLEQGTATEAMGWSTSSPTNAGDATVETANTYSGIRAIRLKSYGSGSAHFQQGSAGGFPLSTIPFTPGKTYTFSLYAKGAAGGEKLRFATPLVTGPTETMTTSWKRYSWTFTAQPDTHRGMLQLGFGSTAGETTYPKTLYVDALQLEEGQAPTRFEPVGQLLLDGFNQYDDGTGLTPTAGKVGAGIVVDNGLNLIPNSSFELDGDSDGMPDGYAVVGTKQATYSLEPQARFHSKALKIVMNPASTEYVRQNVPYDFKVGRQYTFSIWVKGQGVSGISDDMNFGLYADFRSEADGTGSYLGAVKAAAPTGTFDWTRISGSVTLLKPAKSVSVIPMLRGKTGTAWFDGFQLEEGGVATPYAGDGPDRLGFDAARKVSPQQGTLSYWYMPSYGWEDERAGATLAGLSSFPGNNVVMSIGRERDGNGRLMLRYRVHDGAIWHSADWLPTSAPWKAGEWHHLAVTWGGRGLELYLDGTRVATSPYSGSLFGGGGLGQLLFQGLGGNYFAASNGTLDGLQSWDAQRSPESIQRSAMGLEP